MVSLISPKNILKNKILKILLKKISLKNMNNKITKIIIESKYKVFKETIRNNLKINLKNLFKKI